MYKLKLVQLDEDTIEIIYTEYNHRETETLLAISEIRNDLFKVTSEKHEYIVKAKNNEVLHRSVIIECDGCLSNKTKYFLSIEPKNNLIQVRLIDLERNVCHNSTVYKQDFLDEPAYARILELNLYDHKAAAELAKKHDAEALLGHCFQNFYQGSYSRNFFSDDLQVSKSIRNCF